MKYYYLNRIAMAVLVALLLFFGTRTLINIATEEHEPEKPGFEVAGDETPHGKDEKPAGAEGAGGGGSEILAVMATADPAQGEANAALCKVCHTFDKGGATLIGPNLYGVVGHKIASYEGATYTPALKGKEGDWTYENLDVWLTNPQAFAPGTTMAFPGIPDLKKRADVIAFLRSKADTPVPLPEASAEEPAAEEPAMDEEPADEPAAMEEEPAAEEPATMDEEPAAEPMMEEEPAAEPMMEEEPAAEPMMEEDVMEETIVVEPMVSEDAPSEPSMGEPASESQPQPVYPDETMDDSSDGSGSMAPAGDDGLSSQPQPVYPEGEPSMDGDSDSTGSITPGKDYLSFQPQPVYPDGEPEGL